MPDQLLALQEGWRRGRPGGLASVCSAHPMVLRAGLRTAREDGTVFLVEATCNQVNQFGGYTGMTPAAFKDAVRALALEEALPWDRVLLGGDHLGPNPWCREPAPQAMEKAGDLVAAFVVAGFRKIHLDASMPCAGDPVPLPEALIARRTALLCRRAEEASGPGPRPAYVIGTEVPPPGGAGAQEAGLKATSAGDLVRSLEVAERAFLEAGLGRAWERVVAVVVQPGVEFGEAGVHAYDRAGSRGLTEAIERRRPWLYEAHSTDYQTPRALRELVQDRFAILKVGPWLTFAMREALFALEDLARDLRRARPDRPEPRLRECLDAAMRENPAHWRSHHPGTPPDQAYARLFGFSDRCRYYWQVPAVAAEVERLLDATRGPLPTALLSQHLPVALESIQAGTIENDSHAIVIHAVRKVLGHYQAACLRTQTRKANP